MVVLNEEPLTSNKIANKRVVGISFINDILINVT